MTSNKNIKGLHIVKRLIKWSKNWEYYKLPDEMKNSSQASLKPITFNASALELILKLIFYDKFVRQVESILFDKIYHNFWIYIFTVIFGLDTPFVNKLLFAP